MAERGALTPQEAVEWMLRPRGRNPGTAMSRHKDAIARVSSVLSGETAHGPEFWQQALRILTRNRLGTKCRRGHILTLDTLLVTENYRGHVILKCATCDARFAGKRGNRREGYSADYYARNRERQLASSASYYERNRERLLARAKERHAARHRKSQSAAASSTGEQPNV